MIVTALVNTTYKRKVVLAGEAVDMDDATAKVMLKEKKVRKGQPKPAETADQDDQDDDKAGAQ